MKIAKKLRDVTYEEWQNWQKYNCKGERCTKCIFKCVSCLTREYMSWIDNKEIFSDKFLDQTIEVEVPDILNKEEKEYLSAVIKPFRDRVDYIEKVVLPNTNEKFIKIGYSEGKIGYSMSFPYLPNDEMYKGMKGNRPYKLEELGL